MKRLGKKTLVSCLTQVIFSASFSCHCRLLLVAGRCVWCDYEGLFSLSHASSACRCSIVRKYGMLEPDHRKTSRSAQDTPIQLLFCDKTKAGQGISIIICDDTARGGVLGGASQVAHLEILGQVLIQFQDCCNIPTPAGTGNRKFSQETCTKGIHFKAVNSTRFSD